MAPATDARFTRPELPLVPRSFVAIGDSFTEGLDDPDPSRPGGFRGWADRVAATLSDVSATTNAPDAAFAYANLAIRGRKLGQIIDEQLPRALELRADLVSIAGGTNDVLRPKVDLDMMAATFDHAVRSLRENGAQVLLFQSVDPTPRSRLIGRALPRIRALTEIVGATAVRYGCLVVPMWGARVFTHPDVWSVDRLHLSSEGHARVAGAVLETLGLGDHAWADELGAYDVPDKLTRMREDAVWARRHLVPWVSRRLRGVSSGDSVTAKRPDLVPVAGDASD